MDMASVAKKLERNHKIKASTFSSLGLADTRWSGSRSTTGAIKTGEVLSNHDELMSNFFAQPDALAYGKTPQELQNENVPPHLIPLKEWSEKQMEFSLLFGKPEKTKAMKAGIARHAVLEEEVCLRTLK
ncbi:Glucose-6-phosphate isomerase, cytosolic 1 [Camellia lanceoleosa]|uniref:Glucose-6-phosphate isomerase, cytosolic 1 n=1 Tax=Camellia lanceoleosa TaxID=1840588 RepID=A0ACC0FJA7_9ERIC|nr:Glucose-6-phosphate isomerase, cytosolic 1 [Camellia lanceoleosa]